MRPELLVRHGHVDVLNCGVIVVAAADAHERSTAAAGDQHHGQRQVRHDAHNVASVRNNREGDVCDNCKRHHRLDGPRQPPVE
jgi:hypothetical protein